VAPLRLGGLRGKQSTPSDWLGGTGELSTVGKKKRHGAREAAWSTWTTFEDDVKATV
jgi:hypothetical protein